jgi:hypothetical protein
MVVVSLAPPARCNLPPNQARVPISSIKADLPRIPIAKPAPRADLAPGLAGLRRYPIGSGGGDATGRTNRRFL